ncbi:hypothetical protein CA13_66820 [Planctomycetes bacterium CA13]|uniref:DUF1549 domain-containing protein n=1 Tax=Novipirellula herctigrandis TaxID=2527986 RepID=A0A5C5YMM5_9BACT|nr:hypothetical protein CA13_66820 [Planctomycetes bacterium CA13]
MSRELTPTEEQAVDALITEVYGTSPPDLSQQILTRLREETVVAPQVRTKKDEAQPIRKAKPNGSRSWWILATAASIAALLIGAMFVRNARQRQVAINGSDVPSTNLAIEANSSDAPSSANQRTHKPQSPPKRTNSMQQAVVLNQGAKADQLDRDIKENDSSEVFQSPREPDAIQPITLVSKQIGLGLRDYWVSVAVEPTEDAAVIEVADRLSETFGIEVPPTSIESVESFDAFLAEPQNAVAVASQLLMQVTEGGLARLDRQNQTNLSNDLASCFKLAQPFDRLIAGWLSKKGPTSDAWWKANSANQESPRAKHSMARRIAKLTMNVDLRCIRCHDAKIESRGKQSEYWSFVGLMAQRPGQDVFYETANGTQKMVEAVVPPTWLGQTNRDDGAINSLDQFASGLVGSRELAKGTINAIWELVNGRPLVGSVVDLSTTPHTDSLLELQDNLVDDLLASNFDLGRSLALVVTSPAARRSVPETLDPTRSTLASLQELELANEKVSAFAAASPRHRKVSLAKKIEFANRSFADKVDGSRLDVAERSSLLAQIFGEDSDTSKRSQPQASTKAHPKLEAYPYRAEALPLNWLDSVAGLDEQIRHLGYVASLEEVPRKVTNVATQMQTAGVARPLILHRVWWMIHP